MLEILGVIAIIYILYKILPSVLVFSFKFGVICVGLITILIFISLFYSEWYVNFY